MKTIKTLSFRLLLAALLIVAGNSNARAWDNGPDGNGKYDKYYDRPTHFPDWEQPSDWPNAEYYAVVARFGTNGSRVENYEVAVYDQNNKLRHCNRSMAKDNHACVLTVRGEEGEQFHCQIIYGDFDNPTIVDVPETFGFKTNDIVGSAAEPFYLTLPGRTYLSETDTELPKGETGANVTVFRNINAGVWSTICLPFAIPEEKLAEAFGTEVTLADFIGCDVTYQDQDEEIAIDINVKFKTANAIEANHPYIIKVTDEVTEISIDGADIIPLDEGVAPSVDCDEQKVKVGSNYYSFFNSFIGNYTNGTIVPQQKLILSNGKFQYSTGETQLMAFHAYFDFYDVLAEMEQASDRISLYINGKEIIGVGIQAIPYSLQNSDALYMLDGRKANGQLKKGIYITNGKKILVR